MPSRNLVKHLGFSADAPHRRRRRFHLDRMPLEPMEWSLVHLPHRATDYAADRWMDRTEQRIRWRDVLAFQLAHAWRNLCARWTDRGAIDHYDLT